MGLKPRRATRSSFWPCQLVELDDGSASIIFTDFDLTEAHFGGRDAGGYAVANLLKRIARSRSPDLLRRVSFDPEASMFAAYGRDREALRQIALLLRELADVGEEEAQVEEVPVDAEQAEPALLAGFVTGLDASAQARFFQLVPRAPASPAQRQRLDALRSDDPADRKQAARRMNSEARTRVRRWGDYLGDPRTIDVFLQALAREQDSAVYEELLWALAFFASRHLPDLRLRPVFEQGLTHPRANVRWIAVLGASQLYSLNWDKVLALRDDRVKKVRDQVARATRRNQTFPIWMFHDEVRREAPPFVISL